MSSTDIVGKTLGDRYKIQSLIGQGGMASVYKANDPNLHRSVAIKVIHPHLSDNPEFFRRFEEEATGVAQLRHPNIVQMYDFNHDDDLYYMVMEFVMGETLQTRLKRLNASNRQMSIKDAVTFTAEICEAAYFAHQRGMIHRDIKPANIMLDVNGRAILMDFGIARMVDASQHTATGTVLGTATYMPPEQIQGLQIDARADIYSIGVTLFETLSGKPPFEADSAMTLMMMHLNDPIPDLNQLHPGTPPELLAIANKALAKNRDQRYQNANEMASALRSVPEQSEETPAVAAPPPAAPPDETIVEASAAVAAGQTIVETPPQPEYEPTLIEQAPPAVPPTTPPPTDVPPVERVPDEPKKGRPWLPLVLVLLVLVLGAGGYFAYTNFFAGGSTTSTEPTATAGSVAQVLPVETEEPTEEVEPTTPAEPTDTAVPSATPTEAPTPTPAPPVIGGADKIGFVNGKNIWAANLDGSELTQLTDDGSDKTYLRWLPDGQGLSYISGKCIEMVSLQGEVAEITCFNNSDRLEGFEVSPDGEQVVIGLDSQVYLVPFDLEALSTAYSHDSLSALATCANLAPYTRNSARYARWSSDSKRWAVVLQVPYQGLRADVVGVFPVDTCFPEAYAAFEVQFPPPHFTFPGYDNNPVLQDLGFDGNSLFAFHGITRNGGFGDLHFFNMDSFRFSEDVNPVNGTCCYRDAEFSPDGSYLAFAYQDIGLGQDSTTHLYYVPFGSIGTGETYEPLLLPEIADPRESPQPVLRRATRDS